MAASLKLYSYWRSSAAWRVRIALNLKQLPYEVIPVHLVANGGEQHTPEYREVNPQEFVPTLLDGARVFRQSLAIIEYLDEVHAGAMSLLPSTARDRARVRAIAQIVACDIHPLNNLRVMQFLEREFATPQVERDRWTRHWIEEGFRAVEALLGESASTGLYCDGDVPTLADVCLVPQVYNARRFGVDMGGFPTIERIDKQCREHAAFEAARPENQPDAPAQPAM